MPWGDRVAKRREELGLSQADLAELCQPLTQQAISRVENSTVLPKDRTKYRLAESLGTTVEELFPWSDFDITVVRVDKARKEAARAAAQRRQAAKAQPVTA